MRNINWHNLEAGYLIKQFFLYFSHSGSGVIKSTSHSIFVSPIFIISLVVFILLLLLFRWIYVLWRATTEKSILLELTPPAFTDKSAYTTKELFSVIHGLGKHQRLLERFLGIKPKLSFEIVSTKDQGIRYVVRTTPHYANNFKRYMLSYLPQVQVKETNEYLAKGLKESKKYQSRITEFKLDRHFAYPLKRQDTLSEHDPVAYITGMMTKLTPNELISFQIVLSPTKTNETHHIKRMILHNENVLAYLDSFQLPVFLKPIVVVLRIFSALIFKLGSEFQWAVSELMHPDTQPVYLRQNYAYQQMQIQQQIKPARTLTSFEETTIQSIQEKIDQPLFETTIRLLVMVKDNEEQKERIDGFVSSMETYAVSGYQSLVKKSLLSDIVFGRIRKVTFNKRLLSLMGSDGSSLLSSSEIADLYHFPFSTITQTESLVKSHSRELPVPVSLKQTAKLDVLVGQNTYGGEITPIGLRLPERYRHAYILGGTGCGKSTMLFYMIMQDIKAGKGVILIDPHGDLAQLIGRSIPKERLKDVIYWDPMDISHPVRLNLLQRTPGLDEDEAALEKELIVEHIISIFRKVFSTELSSTEVNAIRIERMFRNALYTALELDNPTLPLVFDLLVNPEFRQNAIANLKNKRLKDFWEFEFNKAGDFQRVKMSSGINTRIERFLFSEIARRVMEDYISTINFEQIMDEGKILICNFSKGKLGEDNMRLFGTMVLGEIQLATQKRARKELESRRDFFVYVDEFQNFATRSFVDMMAESRKYGVYVTIVEQSTSQQRDRDVVNIIFANVGTFICFKNSNTADEELILPIFKPYVSEGEIFNLPTYRFYVKISAVNPQEPFSGETILPKIAGSKKRLEEVIRVTRQKYAPLYVKPKEPQKVVTNENKNDKPNKSSQHIPSVSELV